jgi:putative ABC transport system permease protein
MTLSTLLKFNIRYYRRHALLSGLCLMGIALGVGIVVAVELINASALASFSASVDLLSGKATHSIISNYGRIDEENFRSIWAHPDIEAASPVIEAMAETRETAREPIRFIGIDPFLDVEFRPFVPETRPEGSLVNFLGKDGPSAWVSNSLIKRYGLAPGDTLTVLSAGIEKKVRILGVFPEPGGAVLGDNVALVDLSVAQDLFGRKGYLDRIDIISHVSPQNVLKGLPNNLRITDSNTRKSMLGAMLYSFQLNLAAMSLLALFVGIFLIYNFSMFSVLSRREDIALLLTLGSDRRGLVTAFLGESLLLGVTGSLLGIALGVLVAWVSMDKVSSTISELYFHLRVEAIHLTAPIVWSGLGVGLLATVVGTGLPALEVAVTPPVLGIKRQSIEDRAHGLKNILLVCGIGISVLALTCAWASRFSIYWGFVSAFGMTLAFALFTPSFLSPFSHYTGMWLKNFFGSLEGFLAARTIRASLSRTSIAVAALAVALSMTIGVDTMIHSFRNSVSSWLEGSLKGDLYVSPGTTKWDHPLPQELIEALSKDTRIADVEHYSTYNVLLQGRPVKLRVVDGAVLEHHSDFRFLKGEKDPWAALRKGGIFISESLGFHFLLEVGHRVELNTPDGTRSFPIVAVVRDYSSDQGTIHIDRKIYETIWKDKRVQSVAIFLKPDVSPDEVRRSIATKFQGLDRTIVSNSKMKKDILVIFDKTFAPTATLKGVSLLVALLGVATALMAILLERSREMQLMAYLGLTPRELGKMNLYQALIMGLAAFLMSVLCGLVLTYIITYAINYRSFGWSIDMYLDPKVFAKTLALTAVACLASSLYPTFRLTRGIVVDGLRED